jgi:hypothetical protein
MDRGVPARRVILLGASNLTLAFPLVLDAVRRSLSGPVDVFAAHGHGRSFCSWSYVLHRGLPSILDCGLWPALTARPPAGQTWALITDLGNDLVYGRPPERVLAQFQTALDRLLAQGAAITFVRPPLERILQLSERQYLFAKKLLFPGPAVPWQTISQWVQELDDAAAAATRSAGGVVLAPRRDWYGLDPIHIRRSQRPRAWGEILESWSFPEALSANVPSPLFAWRTWNSAPAERSYWKIISLRSQPAWKIEERVALWLY